MLKLNSSRNLERMKISVRILFLSVILLRINSHTSCPYNTYTGNGWSPLESFSKKPDRGCITTFHTIYYKINNFRWILALRTVGLQKGDRKCFVHSSQSHVFKDEMLHTDLYYPKQSGHNHWQRQDPYWNYGGLGSTWVSGTVGLYVFTV